MAEEVVWVLGGIAGFWLLNRAITSWLIQRAVRRDYQSRLLESANALILGIDRQWRITVCNRALHDLTGFERDEVLDAMEHPPAEKPEGKRAAKKANGKSVDAEAPASPA